MSCIFTYSFGLPRWYLGNTSHWICSVPAVLSCILFYFVSVILPISFRITSMVLGQSCPGTSKVTLKDIDCTKHNKTQRCMTLRWRHNGHDSVSNHQPHECLLKRLFRSKKTSKLRVTGLCVGNLPGTGEFPAQMTSNAENVSIWWRHHGIVCIILGMCPW